MHRRRETHRSYKQEQVMILLMQYKKVRTDTKSFIALVACISFIVMAQTSYRSQPLLATVSIYLARKQAGTVGF